MVYFYVIETDTATSVFGYLPLSVRVFLLFVLDNLSSHFTKYVIMCVICNVVLCDFEQIVRYETHVLLVLYKQKFMLWEKTAVSINAKINDTRCVKVILHYVSSSLSPYLQFKENLLFLPSSMVTKKLTKPDRTLNIILVFLSESCHLAVFAQKI